MSEASLSHVYSFTSISAFIYFLKKYSDTKNKKHLALSGLLLGCIVLIRPVNGLIVFILPFISGSKENFLVTLKAIFKLNSGIILSILLFIFIISLQAIIYKIQIGKFYIYSYTIERFIWNRPEIINILFSYRKGLFVYTPVTFFALAGFIIAYRKNTYQLITFLLFFLLLTYVLSSWWLWSYGGSFSARPFVEYLSLFGILLAILLENIKNKSNKIISGIILVLFIILCQVQTLQYRYFIIHWDKMDKEHYWRVFMRPDLDSKKINPNDDLLK